MHSEQCNSWLSCIWQLGNTSTKLDISLLYLDVKEISPSQTAITWSNPPFFHGIKDIGSTYWYCRLHKDLYGLPERLRISTDILWITFPMTCYWSPIVDMHVPIQSGQVVHDGWPSTWELRRWRRQKLSRQCLIDKTNCTLMKHDTHGLPRLWTELSLFADGGPSLLVLIRPMETVTLRHGRSSHELSLCTGQVEKLEQQLQQLQEPGIWEVL